jgi:dTMP kinase
MEKDITGSRDYPGLFVVIEGIDGTGKSTLASNIYQELRNRDINTLLTFEPTKGQWGKKLRQSFTSERLPQDEELSLFMKDRKEHLEDVIIPALKDGRVVICDRYYYSTAAYQGARGMDPEKIIEKNRRFALEPDLVLLLELDPERAVERIKSSRSGANSFEALDYLKRVSAIYDSMQDANIIRLDASQPAHLVARQAVSHILERLKEKGGA